MTDTIAQDAALEAYLAQTHEARLESYKAFLRIPSVSGIPAHAPDCRAASQSEAVATWKICTSPL